MLGELPKVRDVETVSKQVKAESAGKGDYIGYNWCQIGLSLEMLLIAESSYGRAGCSYRPVRYLSSLSDVSL